MREARGEALKGLSRRGPPQSSDFERRPPLTPVEIDRLEERSGGTNVYILLTLGGGRQEGRE